MPTLLQSNFAHSGTSQTTLAVAFPGNVTAGSLLLAYIGNKDASTGTSSAADNLNGSWPANNINDGGTGNLLASINSFPNSVGGAITITATIGVPGHFDLIIEEWSGMVSSNAFDVGHAGSGNSTTPSSGATAAIAQGNELVVGFLMLANTPVITAGSGYTLSVNGSGLAASEYQILTSGSGAQTATFGMGTAFNWECLVATYKAAAVVVGPSGGMCM